MIDSNVSSKAPRAEVDPAPPRNNRRFSAAKQLIGKLFLVDHGLIDLNFTRAVFGHDLERESASADKEARVDFLESLLHQLDTLQTGQGQTMERMPVQEAHATLHTCAMSVRDLLERHVRTPQAVQERGAKKAAIPMRAIVHLVHTCPNSKRWSVSCGITDRTGRVRNSPPR